MTPKIRLTVGGKDITADVSKRCGVIEWTDGVEEKSDTLHLTLQDSDNSLEVPKKGAAIELFAGYDGQLQKIGSYTVNEAELAGPPDTLTVQATAAPFTDKSGKSASTRLTKSWTNTTVGDIAKSIASQLGVSAVVDATIAAIPITNEQQSDESNTNFLLRISRRFGAYLKFVQGRMVVAEEGTGKGAGGAVINATIKKSEVSKWSVKFGGKAEGLTKVVVKYHDYTTGTTKKVEAEITAPASASAFSDVAWLASKENTFTPSTPAASEPEAKAIAKTTAKRIARATRSFSISLPGRLGIIAGGKITLAGFRNGVNGQWLVKNVSNRIDSQGWAMTVSGEGIN
jgi:hypothetical protein